MKANRPLLRVVPFEKKISKKREQKFETSASSNQTRQTNNRLAQHGNSKP